MNAYTRAENVDGAEDVLRRMLEDGGEAQPNVRTYSALMNCYVKAGLPRGAEEVGLFSSAFHSAVGRRAVTGGA